MFEEVLTTQRKLLSAQRRTATALERIVQLKLYKYNVRFEGNVLVPNSEEQN